MSIPSSATQVLALLILVVPGFVFQAVRIRMVGRTSADIDLPVRVLRAIVTSTVFALVYVLALGRHLTDVIDSPDASVVSRPRAAALLGLLTAVVIPGAAAALRSFPWRAGFVRTRAFWRRPMRTWRDERPRFESRPSAWDLMLQAGRIGFVRVQMADGSWFGGYFGPLSWASSYPDTPSLFVQKNYRMTEAGAFAEPVEGSGGAVIECAGAVLIELIAGLADPPTTRQNGTEEGTDDAIEEPAAATRGLPAHREHQ